jgi:hypothetical protein
MINLERAHDPAHIRRRDSSCRFRVNARKKLMQALRPFLLRLFLEPPAKLPIGPGRGKLRASHERPQIETGSPDGYRKFSSRMYLLDDLRRIQAILGGAVSLRRVEEIYEVHGNEGPLLRRWFCRAYIEMAINLKRVGVDDFTSQYEGALDCSPGLACGGGTADDEKWWQPRRCHAIVQLGSPPVYSPPVY